METLINIQQAGVKYTAAEKLFVCSGKQTKFDTSYKLENSETKKNKVFQLSHSTGSEWDPKTIWVYKSEDGYTLHILNDDVTQAHADAYLQHKLGN